MRTIHKFSGVHTRASQSGVTLVIALLFVLALTLLGVSAMSTVVVEEKMADNSEKLNRAFQAAESGVVRAMRDLSLFNTSMPTTGNTGPIGSSDLSADFAIQYHGRTEPNRAQNGWGVSSANFHHFDIKSQGKSTVKGGTVLHQGVYVVGPASGGG